MVGIRKLNWAEIKHEAWTWGFKVNLAYAEFGGCTLRPKPKHLKVAADSLGLTISAATKALDYYLWEAGIGCMDQPA